MGSESENPNRDRGDPKSETCQGRDQHAAGGVWTFRSLPYQTTGLDFIKHLKLPGRNCTSYSIAKGGWKIHRFDCQPPKAPSYIVEYPKAETEDLETASSMD